MSLVTVCHVRSEIRKGNNDCDNELMYNVNVLKML